MQQKQPELAIVHDSVADAEANFAETKDTLIWIRLHMNKGLGTSEGVQGLTIKSQDLYPEWQPKEVEEFLD